MGGGAWGWGVRGGGGAVGDSCRLGPSEESMWVEPHTCKDFNEKNASLWKHSAFSKK